MVSPSDRWLGTDPRATVVGPTSGYKYSGERSLYSPPDESGDIGCEDYERMQGVIEERSRRGSRRGCVMNPASSCTFPLASRSAAGTAVSTA